jgi:hypothetical protein
VRVENGHLVIDIKAEPFNGKRFTSARLISKHWLSESPKGKHLWPAIWMMSQKSVYRQWFVLKVNFKEALILLIISETYLQMKIAKRIIIRLLKKTYNFIP